jgi:hypothetical protein
MTIPNNPYNNYPQPSGWCCPKCNRVYSPSTSECWSCNNQNRPWNNPVTCSTTGTDVKHFDNSEIKFTYPYGSYPATYPTLDEAREFVKKLELEDEKEINEKVTTNERLYPEMTDEETK